MECPIEARGKKDLLLDYCAHALDAREAAEFETHLASCAACKAWPQAHMRTWTLLDDWQPAPVSPDFDRKLYQRIAAEQARLSWWRALWRSLAARPLKPALSLALAGLIVLAGLLFVRPAPPPPVHKAQTQEALDADRIEKALDDVDMLRQLGTSGGSNSETM